MVVVNPPPFHSGHVILYSHTDKELSNSYIHLHLKNLQSSECEIDLRIGLRFCPHYSHRMHALN
jgi:hypothetical protein